MKLDQFGFYFYNYCILFSIFIELLERQYLCPLLVETSDYAGLLNIQYAIQNNLEQSEYHLKQLSKLLLFNYSIWNIEFEIQCNFSTHLLNSIAELDSFNSVLRIILDLKNFKSKILYSWGAKIANQKGELEISQILTNMSISEAKTAKILAQY
uniref:Uncharacterized protein n=1 Tax=Nitellopsis obtusa TaxID=40811 RepID=A0A8F6U4B4_9VIRI|nr:hypothetical protein [Nitellopsis obtusa]